MAGREARAVPDVPEVSTGDLIQEAWGDQVAQAINNHAHDGTAGQAGEDRVSHPTLSNIGPDDHHARLHAADHASGGADPIAAAPSLPPNIVVFAADGSYDKPAGLVAVMVEVVGGGGGSGGCGATAAGERSGGGAGGGGGYSRKMLTAAELAASEVVTVGVGGAAGAAGTNPGQQGETSSFGAHCQATGGKGGQGGPTSGSGQRAFGGDGGVGSNGDLNFAGEKGGTHAQGYNAVVSNYTYGGSSFYSGSVGPNATASAAMAGLPYGGGASGPQNDVSAAAKAGAKGGDGVVIVTEYF